MSVFGGRVVVAVPPVRILSDDAEGAPLAPAADHQDRWRVGYGDTKGIFDAVVRAGEGRRAALPERRDDRSRLVQLRDALVGRGESIAVGVVLGLGVARAEAEDEPPAGEELERRRDLRRQRRIAIPLPEHERTPAETGGLPGQPGD